MNLNSKHIGSFCHYVRYDSDGVKIEAFAKIKSVNEVRRTVKIKVPVNYVDEVSFDDIINVGLNIVDMINNERKQ